MNIHEENKNALNKKFEAELIDKMRRAKRECGYNPTRFNQMLSRYGGLETAKRLIANSIATGTASDGFGTLLLCGRLDLSMEDSVCKEEYAKLFSAAEVEHCRKMLGRS